MSEIRVVPRWLVVVCYLVVAPFLFLAVGRIFGIESARWLSLQLAPEYIGQLPVLPTPSEYLHRIVGTLDLITFALQSLLLRTQRWLKIHKVLGRVYVLLMILVDGSGFWMIIQQPFGNWLEVGSTFLFGNLMLAQTLVAVWFIRRRNHEQHHLYMLRGFAILYGNVTVRLIYAPLWMILGLSERDGIGWAFLTGWLLNILVMEYLIYRYRQRKASQP